MQLLLISLILCTVQHFIAADYAKEKQSKGVTIQPCYSCSSQSDLCKDEVYDGTYLTKVPCKTKCYVRREGKEIYRGCFDGWLGGMVKYKYDGCRTQNYLGKQVEWCFCSGDSDNLNQQPCNRQSFKDLGSTVSQSAFEYSAFDNRVNNYRGQVATYGQPLGRSVVQKSASYQGMPVPDYKQYMQINVGQSSAGVLRSSSNIEAKEGGRSAGYGLTSKYKIECYECHDGFPYCGKHITRPDYVAVKGCKSQCFIRKERDNVYRGCFDGWLKTSVKHNYNGCSVQDVYGTKVEWCFCDSNLCNGRSMDDMGNTRQQLGSSGFDMAVDQYSHSSSEEVFPAADEISTYKNLDAREGVVKDGEENKFGVADGYDNNVYNYAPSGVVSPPTMCRGLPNGVYTDPFDCVMYINCLNGYTYRRRCPPGTAWNPDSGFCDYEHKVSHMCKPVAYSSAPSSEIDSQWIVEDDTYDNADYQAGDNNVGYTVEDFSSAKDSQAVKQ